MARVSLQEYCDEARELIAAGAPDEAIGICRHILKRYPKHIRAYQILGEACLEKGEYAEAIDIFQRLMDHADPENLSACAGLGFAYKEQRELTQAIWYMERALELAPNSEETRNALRRLYAERDGVEPTRLRHSKPALARLYARGGQYRQAIEEFRRLLALELYQGRMDLKVSLAETLWRDGRHEQAAELAREILQVAPDCLKAVLILGEILIEKGRRAEGLSVLDRARALDPENRMAWALFGEDSPLPARTVLIPRMEPPTTAEPSPTAPIQAEQTLAEPAEVVAGPEAKTSIQEVGGQAPAELGPEAVEAGRTEGTVAPTTQGSVVRPMELGPMPEQAAVGAEPAAVPIAADSSPAKKRRKWALRKETVLESASGANTEALSHIEQYRLLLEQNPKNDDVRLALARAYRDTAQMKLALEQYGLLLRARQKLLPEIVADVEGIVASRPDNLQAHELLADLYAKSGQLQKALERYRWVLQRLQQPA